MKRKHMSKTTEPTSDGARQRVESMIRDLQRDGKTSRKKALEQIRKRHPDDVARWEAASRTDGVQLATAHARAFDRSAMAPRVNGAKQAQAAPADPEQWLSAQGVRVGDAEAIAAFDAARRRKRQDELIVCGVGELHLGLSIDDPRLPAAYRAAWEWLLLLRARRQIGALCGPSGSGKTALASMLVVRAYDEGATRPRIITAAEFVRRLLDQRPGRKQEFFEALVGGSDVLVIDEAQEEREGSAWGDQSIVDLVKDRERRCRATLLVSNLSAAKLREALGEPTFERLRDGGGIRQTTWPSLRLLRHEG